MLLWKISIGFFLGLVFGISIGPIAPMSEILSGYVIPFVELIGKIFLRLLMMLIVPLVFASLVSGAASIGDVKKLGRIGFKTLALYIVTTAVAIVIGLVCGNIFQAGAGMDIPGNIHASASQAKPFFDVILEIFPTNPVSSMSSANMLQIIVFAPYGVFALIAGTVSRLGLSVLLPLAKVISAQQSTWTALRCIRVYALCLWLRRSMYL